MLKSVSRRFLIIKSPSPLLEIQKQIVADMEAIEQQSTRDTGEIERLKSEISALVATFSEERRISEVCELSDKRIDPGTRPDNDFNYVGLEHIESNTGEFLERAVVKGATVKSTKKLFNPGCLLYGKLRPYLNKVVLADFDGVCSTDILVLLPKNGIILKHILLGKAFVDKTAALMKGVSLPRIGVKEFLNLTINWPKQPDQTRIVSELDTREQRIRELKAAIAAAEGKKGAILEKHLS